MGDFVERYIDYASRSTDAPKEFHKFCAYSVLSAIAGRNFFVKYGHHRLYPNIFMLLIGESTTPRKSTCIAIVKDLISAVDIGLILPTNFSEEAFMQALGEKNEGILTYSEFISLMKMMDKDYTSGLKGLLTDIYDTPETKAIKRVNKEAVVLRYPCLSLLCGTTIDFFLGCIKEVDLRTGFIARFLFIRTHELTTPIAWPKPRSDEERNKLKCDLQYLRTKQDIEMSVSMSGTEEYEKWYLDFSNKAKQITNLNISSNVERLKVYCIKFAMLNAIARNDIGIVDKEDFEKAEILIETLAQNLVSIFDKDVAFTDYAKIRQKILKMISSNGGVSWSVLMQKSHIKKRDLLEIVESLKESDEIIEIAEQKERGRPGKRFISK